MYWHTVTVPDVRFLLPDNAVQAEFQLSVHGFSIILCCNLDDRSAATTHNLLPGDLFLGRFPMNSVFSAIPSESVLRMSTSVIIELFV